ncbi:MAG: His/Gly/Thr/Pro-type tRNA ligase C-terminal domain-containing protein, partial [Candidatus Nitrosotenuis sp.]
LSKKEIRVDVDDRNETLGKRIRESETEWIQYTLVIGEKEVGKTNLSIRDRKTGNVKELSIEEFVSEIKEQTKDKPFTKLNLSRNISKRPQIMV